MAVDADALTTVAAAPVAAPIARADAAAGQPRARSRRLLLLGVAALLGTAVIAVALASMSNPGLAEESPSATPLTSPSEASAPVPTQVALPRWAQKLAEAYAEECGSELNPALIAGMSKKEAEAAIEPQIEACNEGD